MLALTQPPRACYQARWRKFVRVHRSHIVNLDYLLEIEPLDTGDARLKLRDGTAVGCSRTYRDALRERSV